MAEEQNADSGRTLAHRAASSYLRMNAPEPDDDAAYDHGEILSRHWLGAVFQPEDQPILHFRDETDWFLKQEETAHHIMEDGSIWTATGPNQADPDPELTPELAKDLFDYAQDQTRHRSFRKRLLISALTRATTDNMMSWDFNEEDGSACTTTRNQIIEIRPVDDGHLLRIGADDPHSQPAIYLYAHSNRVTGVRELYEAAKTLATDRVETLNQLLRKIVNGPYPEDFKDRDIIDNIVMALARHTRQQNRRWRRITEFEFTIFTTILDSKTLLQLTETRETDPHGDRQSDPPDLEAVAHVHTPDRHRTRSLTMAIIVKGVPWTLNKWTQKDRPGESTPLPLLLSAINDASRERATRRL